MVREGRTHQRRFSLGSRTGSSVPNNQSRIKKGTGQYQNYGFNPGIHRVLLTKTQHLPQPRILFWTKQTEEESPEEIWRRLVEIEEECNFNIIPAEELLISKYMTAITDKKLRDKLLKEKILELKKTIELIKQKTYEKKNKKKHNTEGTSFGKRKREKNM